MGGVANWEYEIDDMGDGVYLVTYYSDKGAVVPSSIPFESEEEADIAAQDYIENLDALYPEWQ